jgi:ABC-type dipeptide/oligopeptide/nickel transport system ATPase subunit
MSQIQKHRVSHIKRQTDITMAGSRRTIAILVFLLTSLTCSLAESLNLNTDSRPSINIRFVPSRVEFQQVSQQYPETLARRLFSSVPRREFALHNVSWTMQSELTLLTGASSSGKSALMKIVSGVETPVQGSVHIQCLWKSLPTPTPHAQWVAQPVYLDQRPSIDGRRTARQILCQHEEIIIQKLLLIASSSSSSKTTNQSKQQSSSSSLKSFLKSLLNALTAELCSCLQLTTTTSAWMDQTPLQLSSSQSYRLALVTACLESSMANLSVSVDADADIDVDTLFPTSLDADDKTTERRTVSLPAPILLLDEWMDTETTEIVQTVQRGLEQLAQSSDDGVGVGAVIVSATHKRERWKKPYSEMVLSRGQVLSWNRIES